MPQPRTALVTGANRGLGRAVAAELHRRGVKLVVTAREYGAAAAVADELCTTVGAHQLDVTDEASIERARADIGRVDILVSNAGVLLDGGTDPMSVPLELVERTLSVNLIGSWRVVQAFVPDMVAQGWGRVVFVSSGTGAFSAGLFRGAPGYSLSKTGINGLTQMLATHLKGSGVLVNAVNPGPTKTRMMPQGRRTPQEAAVDIADAATLPDGGPTGTFRRGEAEFGW